MRRLRSVALSCLVAALSLAVCVPLGGCDNLFGIEKITPPPPGDMTVDPPPGLDNGYTCECKCTYGDGGESLTPLRVCVPAALNPNLVAGVVPSALQLMDDCLKRVQFQVQKMSNKCFSTNPTCTCLTADPLPDTFYDASCDQGCAATPLDDTCSNWDIRNGIKDANCAGPTACADPGPVCLRQGTDPSAPTPSPLAAGIMGRISRCRVTDGKVTVTAGDQHPESPLTGVVNFAPAPPGSCPPDQECVTMDYRLDTTGTIHFDGFLGFGDTDFENVVTSGASTPFVLPTSGSAFVSEGATQTSGRGTQDGSHRALFGSNADRIVVGFDGNACGVQGALVGGVGDPGGDHADFTVAVRVSGVVDNTPPHASLGPNRSVECTSPTGADVGLDGSASTDRENNIVSYGWFLGTRAGAALGSGSTITVQQPLGAQAYFVKTIDEFMQADEASATITVADTTGPTVACNAPATVTPRRTPYSFTATATDVCDAALAAPQIVGFECFAFNSTGRRVARKCSVQVSGSTFTIIDSGGIGDHIQWRVRATDAPGNAAVSTCETQIVRPGPGPV